MLQLKVKSVHINHKNETKISCEMDPYLRHQNVNTKPTHSPRPNQDTRRDGVINWVYVTTQPIVKIQLLKM